MENEKQVGLLIGIAVSLIVGVILLVGSAQNIGPVINTVEVANESVGVLDTGGTDYITGYKNCQSVIIFNATGDVPVPSSNYTLTNNVVYNGNEVIKVVSAAQAGAGCGYNAGTATFQGTCQLPGYDTTSGGRAVAGVIIILFAIALAVVALYPTIKEAASFGVR